MNTTICTIFGALAVSGAPLTSPTAPASAGGSGFESAAGIEDQSLQTVLYDVSFLRLEFYAELGEQFEMSQVPALDLNGADECSQYSETDANYSEESILQLVDMLYGDEFQGEGRRLEMITEGRLLVTAPEAVQTGVRYAIEFLAQASSEQVEVLVDVVDWPLDSELAPPPASMSAVAAERWLAGLPPGCSRSTQQLALRPDRIARIDESRDIDLVIGYWDEIAEASAAYNPITTVANVGTRMQLLATAADGGAHLSCQLRSTRELGQKRLRESGVSGVIFTEDGQRIGAAGPRTQDFGVSTSGVGWSTFLRDGGAISFVSRYSLPRAERQEAVVIRHLRGSLQPRYSLPLGKAASVELIDMRALQPARVVAYGSVLREVGSVPNLLNHLGENGYGSSFGLRNQLQERDLDFAGSLMMAEVETLDCPIFGPWLLAIPGGWADGDEERLQQSKTELDGMLEAMRLLQPDHAALQLELRVSLQRASGEIVARASLPALLGQSVSLALGTEELFFGDVDVDVAQHASASVLRTGSLFDGLALWLRIDPGAKDGLNLELRGGAHLVGEKSAFECGDRQTQGILDQADRERLFVCERVHLEPDAARGQRWTRRVGSLAEDGDALSLVIEIMR